MSSVDEGQRFQQQRAGVNQPPQVGRAGGWDQGHFTNPSTGQNGPQHPNAQQPAQSPYEAFHPYTAPPGQTNEKEKDFISGNAPIARKSGEVLVMSYDIGTTACKCAFFL